MTPVESDGPAFVTDTELMRAVKAEAGSALSVVSIDSEVTYSTTVGSVTVAVLHWSSDVSAALRMVHVGVSG